MLKKTILILFTSLLLQACVPAAVVGGAATTGTLIADRRSMGTMITDRKISKYIHTHILNTSQLKSSHISVTTYNGTVLLAGQAPSAADRYRAVQIAENAPHVKRIYNQISIGHAISKRQKQKDTWITAKARTVMFGTNNLSSNRIKVTTENGTLYLMGLVTRSQGQLAANAVRKIKGVRRVVKLFEYTPR